MPNFFKVWASRARLPITPGFAAAAANFFAGIVCPFFTPSELRKAPGFDIALDIHFSAMIYSGLVGQTTSFGSEKVAGISRRA